MKHKVLFKPTRQISTSDGNLVDVVEFDVANSEPLTPEWASHLREHYCLETELEGARSGTGKSRAEFIKEMILPTLPQVISSEFAEILVADFIEFLLGYQVPRVRYLLKMSPNALVQGVDIVCFKRNPNDSKLDELLTCEVKAALVASNPETLKNAISDAVNKDPFRVIDTMVALKRRYAIMGNIGGAQSVERFQNKTERPYVYVIAAAAVHSDATWDDTIASNLSCEILMQRRFKLLVIKGPDMMGLAYKLYEAACA